MCAAARRAACCFVIVIVVVVLTPSRVPVPAGVHDVTGRPLVLYDVEAAEAARVTTTELAAALFYFMAVVRYVACPGTNTTPPCCRL